MKLTTSFWFVAFLVTLVAAYYQRVTGPSYPLEGTTHFKQRSIDYKLPRSHGGPSPALIDVQTGDSSIHGFVEWKRDKTEDGWTRIALSYKDGVLSADLPNQPPAGKLQYRLALYQDDEVAVIPGGEALVIRFKGEVPLAVLIPHIIAMFASMLFAARAGLEFFGDGSHLKKLVSWTIGFLVIGGFVLGPIVQYYAFNAWWTGWPFGTDLTDNKTAIILFAWVGVVIAIKKSKNPRAWALAASVITFVVFLIPHSLLGSEIDYNTLERNKTRIDTIVTHK